jgi:hypothetical protein
MTRIAPGNTLALLLCLPALTGGCLGTGFEAETPADPGLLERGLPFVAISRDLPTEMLARRTQALREDGVEHHASALQGPESFYLAINRRELGKRFFFNAYMKVIGAGGREEGTAGLLGTRVVSFRVQNGKLFVFDVRDNRASSDTVDPTFILEAYPLVQGFSPFKVLRGNDDYVLFDPAAGLNRFHPIISDALEPGTPNQFTIDLSYMQAFRPISDGATFEQVFTGTVIDARMPTPREWGTLGVSIRRYGEGQGFEPFPVDDELPLYFYPDEKHLARNTSGTFSAYGRWNIRPGGKPIEWIISPRWLDLQKELPQYDWVGAVKAGIEGWNQAFGFPALVARMGQPDDSYAQDDKNVIIFDRDPSLGYAFANVRNNPNTGETRGASVYFGGVWIEGALALLDPAAVTAPPTTVPPPAQKPPTLLADARPTAPRRTFTWNNLRPQSLCERHLAVGRRALDVPGLSPTQRVEAFMTHNVLHEIGHTLGLQHNFMGSLGPAHTSVMEYVPNEEAHLLPTPGPYDVAAIKLLYGLTTERPAQPFCQEDEVAENPRCGLFDSSDEPLGKFWAPMYQAATQALLRAQEPEKFGLNGLAGYLRAGTPEDQSRAWEALREPFKLGVDRNLDEVNHPGFIIRVSLLQNLVLKRLFFDPEEARGEVVKDPVLVGPALVAFTDDLRDTITNSDHIRSWSVRRTAVDVARKMQVRAAYQALLSARDTLTTARPTLTGEEATLTDDLLARIDRAIKPYFER